MSCLKLKKTSTAEYVLGMEIVGIVQQKAQEPLHLAMYIRSAWLPVLPARKVAEALRVQHHGDRTLWIRNPATEYHS